MIRSVSYVTEISETSFSQSMTKNQKNVDRCSILCNSTIIEKLIENASEMKNDTLEN